MAVAALLASCLPGWAFAQTTYFWNGLDPAASPAAGGTGTWDDATLNWRVGTDTGTAVAWPVAGSGADAASFGGTAGTVTLSGTRTANQLGFTVTGYTLTGGTLALDGTAPAISVTTGTATVGSAVSGSAGLVKTGEGTLVLSATNTFTGGTTISAGTLQLNAQAAAANGLITLGDAATGTSDVQLTLNTNIDRSGFSSGITVANQGTGTATIKWIETGVTGNPSTGNGLITLNRATIFDATQLAGAAYLFNHALSGSGDLTLTSSNGVRFLLQAASGGYTGNITVQNGGIFEPRNHLSASTGNNVTVNSGGELRIQFDATSIGGLNGDGIVQSVSGAQTLTVGKGNASGSFAGILRNNPTVLSFTKTGTGTQILSGANSYTGTTTISGGTLQIGAGDSTGTLGSGAVSIGTGGTLDFNRSGSLAVANAISGAGSLVQSGSGAVSLTGTNTYTGTTTISGGTLQIGAGGSTGTLGSGTVSIGTGGTLDFNRSGSLTVANAISGDGSLVQSGPGAVSLTGTNSYAGGTTVVAGTLQIGSTSGAGSGTITLGTSATGTSDVRLTLGSNADRSGFNNAITVANQGTGTATIKWIETGNTSATGNGLITLNRATTFDATEIGGTAAGRFLLFNHALSGAGDLTLTGTNGTRFLLQAASPNYTGDITVQSGGIFEPRTMLSATSGNNLTIESGGRGFFFGTATIGGLNGGGTVEPSPAGGGTISVGKGDASGSFSGSVITGVSVVKTGTGTQVLSGANTSTGGVTISGGTLQIGDGGSTGSVAAAITNNATLAFNRSDAFTHAGTISGTGVVAQSGPGTLTLTGTNTYSGGTTISSGVLATNAGGVGTTGTITVGGGTLRWSAGNTTDYSSRLALVSDATGTLDTNGNDVTLATAFGDSTTGGLAKTGAGTLTLAGFNTYSGPTTVSQGTLAVTGSIGLSATTIASGGVLTGTGATGGLTVANGGTLTPGTAGIGILSVDSLTFGATAGDTATVAIGALGAGGTPSASVSVTGGVTANGSPGSVSFDFGSDLATVPTGTYSLVTYGGSQLSDVSAFTVSGAVGARQGVSVGNGTGSIDLVVTNAWPIWVGDNGSGWSTTDNWVLNTTLAPTSFLAADTVFFSDGASTGAVVITQDVAPTTTTFDGNALDYTLSSSGGFGIVSGNLVKSGSATVTITTDNSYAGGTTISNGVLQVGDGGATGSLGSGSVTNNAALVVNRTGALSIPEGISGSGSLTKEGTGTLTLAGTNTYAGNTAINAGTLVIGSAANQSLAGTLSGSGAIVKAGSGSFSFSSASGFSGAATVVAGTLQLNGAATPSAITLGTSDTGSDNVQITLGANTDRPGFTAPITVSNQGSGTATIKWIETGTTSGSGNGTITFNRAATLDFTEVGGDFFQLKHPFAGSGDITITSTTATRLILDRTDSSGYTGNITVQSGGIFEPRDSLSAPTGNSITVNSGGELRVQFDASTIGGLSGAGLVRPTVGSIALTVGKGDASGSFSGAVQGALSLTKIGTGSQVLSGTNNYTNGTTVVAGTLQIGSTSGAGTGAITLGTAATGANDVRLTLGSNADRSGFNNAITVANEGTGTATIKWIETGNTSATGNGLVTLNRATTFDATEIGGTAAGRYLLFNHALSGAGDLTLTDTNGTRFLLQAASPDYTGNITVQSGGILEPRHRLSANTGNSITVDAGGELRIQFEASTIGGLNGSGTVQPVNSASGTLTIGKGDAGGSFAGSLSGALTLTKTGTGTQLLSGASTYSGTTTISGGTLEAADNAALGTSSVSVAAGATLRLAAGTTITNTLSLAGGGLELISPEALATAAEIVAGAADAPVTLAPTAVWSPQIADTTYSDVLGLTNTAGTIQILELSYDPSILGSLDPADLFLGWNDNGAWVNAIAGNTGSTGGLAVFNQTGSLSSLGILPTADYLGSWGRDTATNTAWAVINHNSDFAVIAVPEPATVALLGVAAGLGLAGFQRRLRLRPEVR